MTELTTLEVPMPERDGELVWSPLASMDLMTVARGENECRAGAVWCIFAFPPGTPKNQLAHKCGQHECGTVDKRTGTLSRIVIWLRPEDYPLARLTR
ncbi:MAG: hypothetical protein JSS14_22025 [Proteobacteria bacterium]|nr:hypothetical protein [Pseudomonadota bacterium]